jgi:hypothetical protein
MNRQRLIYTLSLKFLMKLDENSKSLLLSFPSFKQIIESESIVIKIIKTY